MSSDKHQKELYLDEKWDKLIDLTLRRGVYGLLAGSVVALVLFRELQMIRALQRAAASTCHESDAAQTSRSPSVRGNAQHSAVDASYWHCMLSFHLVPNVQQ